MKSVIALLFTLLASAAAFAPMQQTVGTYITSLLRKLNWNCVRVVKKSSE